MNRLIAILIAAISIPALAEKDPFDRSGTPIEVPLHLLDED